MWNFLYSLQANLALFSCRKGSHTLRTNLAHFYNGIGKSNLKSPLYQGRANLAHFTKLKNKYGHSPAIYNLICVCEKEYGH